MIPVLYDTLTWEERRKVREQYVQYQGGICQHCKSPLKDPPPSDITILWINRDLFPEGFLSRPIHLHHCHKTGYTIGAVHARCNAVLWQYYGE